MEIFKELEEEQLALGLDPPLVNVHLYLTGMNSHILNLVFSIILFMNNKYLNVFFIDVCCI